MSTKATSLNFDSTVQTFKQGLYQLQIKHCPSCKLYSESMNSTCLKFKTEHLLLKLALCHAGHPGVYEGEVSEHRLVDAVDERPVDAGQPRLLVDKLFVEVAAVAGRRLQRTHRDTWTRVDCLQHVAARDHQSAITKVGLQGGVTCRCSSISQSVVLKKPCARMFPFTPRRSSGSLTNN